MKAAVNDKNPLTFVFHLNGVTIIESSGFIIDLDYQCLASICEIANLGNTYTIKDCDEIESLKSNNNELTKRIEFLEKQLTNSGNRITELRNQIEEQENEYKDIIVKKDKIIEEKTNSLIKLENIEDTLNATVKVNEELNTQLSRSKEDIDKLDKQLEEKDF
jgi:chromosome segregation ATPase